MAIQFQEEVVVDGREGIVTMTFELVVEENRHHLLKELQDAKSLLSFAEFMRCSKEPYVTFQGRNFPRRVEVPFERFLEEYKDVDFEYAFLQISTKFMVKNP